VRLTFQDQHSAIITFLEIHFQIKKNTASVIKLLSSPFTLKMNSVDKMVRPANALEVLTLPTVR
jgi:hypothetical protein